MTQRRAPARRAPRRARPSRVQEERALRRVRAVLRAVLPHVPARALRAEARLMGELGVDSLKVAELSVALEEAFERAVFLGDLFAEVDDPSLLTVADLARYLAREVSA